MAPWSRERIGKLPNEEVESLRKNAERLGDTEIVQLCREEQIRRKPVRVKEAGGIIDHDGQYVCEFHFVCPRELGIIRNQDGTIWTGTWVVADEHAENAITHGAIVSLHVSRGEPSYLQGGILAWRKSPRQPRYSGEQQTQIVEGIDFLFEPSNHPMPWKGDATGEKGYAWAPFPE
jgi:hypothetical protein